MISPARFYLFIDDFLKKAERGLPPDRLLTTDATIHLAEDVARLVRTETALRAENERLEADNAKLRQLCEAQTTMLWLMHDQMKEVGEASMGVYDRHGQGGV